MLDLTIPGAVAAILVAALLVTARRDPERRHLRLLAGAIVALEAGLVLRMLGWPADIGVRAMLAGGLWVVSATTFGAMLRERAGLPALGRAAALFGGVTLAAQAWFAFAAPSLVGRIWVVNVGATVIIAAQVLPALSLWGRGGWDRALVVATALFGFLSALRTLTLAGQAGNSEDFSSTAVWAATHLTLVSFTLALTLLALAGTARDELRRVQAERDTDPLTGLHSRRRFEQAADAALANPGLAPVSLVFCDIDHFKSINDAHGHSAGDRVLQSFAAVLSEASREGDFVGRFGGEEFVIMLPATTAADAAVIADRLRRRAGEHLAATLRGSGRVTASFGVAESTAGDGLGALIDRADHQLYVAKAAGRDRVAVAAGPAAGAGHQAT